MLPDFRGLLWQSDNSASFGSLDHRADNHFSGLSSFQQFTKECGRVVLLENFLAPFPLNHAGFPASHHTSDCSKAPTPDSPPTSAYVQEWQASQVSQDIISANVSWAEADEAVELLTRYAIENMGGHAVQYATSAVINLRQRYSHVQAGGWWVSGLDPLNDWQPMDWGQFKPITPRERWNDPDKLIKYEVPAQQNTRAIFLSVSWDDGLKIAQQHNRGAEYEQRIRDAFEDAFSQTKASQSDGNGRLATRGLDHEADIAGQSAFQNTQRESRGTATDVVASSSPAIISTRNGARPKDSGLVLRLLTQLQTEDRGFWEWWLSKPTAPVYITEGAKKAGAALSAGYAAIALPGIYSGYRSKDRLSNPIPPHLIPDVLAIIQPGRPIGLAFDQDEKPSTRRNVAIAMMRFGQLLQAQGCEVRIVRWHPNQGKGIDDLIAKHGPDAFHNAIENALTFEEWQLWQALDNRLTLTSTLTLKTHDLTVLLAESVPVSGIIALASAKGTGKTNLINSLIADSPKVLLAGHRISLLRNLCERCGIHYRGDLDKQGGRFIAGDGYT
ncbi:MAG: DUF3854 domain-containing protein, partial [Phormidesmis sp.]